MKGYLFYLLFLCCISYNGLAQCTTNISQGKTVTFFSETQWAFGYYAVDGNTLEGKWVSQSDDPTEHLTVNLGGSFNICQVKIYWETSTYFATHYKLQTSTNGTSWSDVLDVTDGQAGLRTHTLSTTGNYMRIQMVTPNYTWQNRYEIFEFQVFGTPNTGNQSPTASISSPTNNQSFTAGSNIVIDATAADADGTVSKVEFFQGTTKLGEDLTSPYSYTWNNVSAASYVLTAKATDNSSATTTSAEINITVNAGGGGGSGWTLGGNSGINPALHFLGTTDNQPMIFKTNNLERLSILGNGNIGIGSTNPTARLEIGSTATTSFASGFNNNLRIQGIAPSMQWWDTDNNNGWQVGIDGGNLGFSHLFTQTSITASPLVLRSDGRVKIGTLGRTESDAKLSVDGTIYAKKIKVTQLSWADYVFDEKYSLPKLYQVESFIKANKHLPGVPSAAQIAEKGLDLGDGQALLLKKIEELTLYIIAQEKRINELEKNLKATGKKK